MKKENIGKVDIATIKTLIESLVGPISSDININDFKLKEEYDIHFVYTELNNYCINTYDDLDSLEAFKLFTIEKESSELDNNDEVIKKLTLEVRRLKNAIDALKHNVLNNPYINQTVQPFPQFGWQNQPNNMEMSSFQNPSELYLNRVGDLIYLLAEYAGNEFMNSPRLMSNHNYIIKNGISRESIYKKMLKNIAPVRIFLECVDVNDKSFITHVRDLVIFMKVYLKMEFSFNATDVYMKPNVTLEMLLKERDSNPMDILDAYTMT